VDVHDKIDELIALVESARSMPMSASCIVNRAEVLALLDDVRALLPAELAHAEELIAARDAVVEDGRREYERIMADAEVDQARLVSKTEVVKAAEVEAERLIMAARQECEGMRKETDSYVDGKLANFEIALNKTLSTVHRGRERIRGRHELAELADPGYDADPLPQH
jgi:cell division septum initiation protein DivIVA